MIDYAKLRETLESLGARILEIQATGDEAAARAWVEKYAVITPGIQADIVALELERVPVDIRLSYERQ